MFPIPHPVVAMLLALCSAFCYASAAALQRVETARAAAGTDLPRSGVVFFRALVRRPRWWAGVATMAVGAAVHVVALGFASVALVQPIGVAAVVLALPIDARLERRRVRTAEWAAAAALVVGLAGVLTLAPRHGGERLPSAGVVLATVAVAVAVLAAVVAAGRHLPAVGRAVSRAAAAGICAGATSGLVRVTIRLVATGHRGAPVLVAGGAVVVLPIIGLLLLQTAYRDGGLDAGLATQTTIDPAVATLIGVAVLGERFEAGIVGALLALGCAVIAVIALVALIRASPTPDRSPVGVPG